MKVLVVSNLYPPDFLGGYELGCRQVVDALAARGHKVTVLTAHPRTPVPSTPGVLRRLRLTDVYDPYIMARTVRVVDAGRFVEANGVNAANVHALVDVLQEVRPDVVYFWNLIGLGGLGLMAAAQHTGYPWVMHIMDAVPKVLCTLPFEVRPEVGRAFVRVLRGRYLCCSQTVLDEIVAGGVPIADQAKIVPNWVTTAGQPDRDEWVPDGHLRVVTAGSVSVSKGIDVLIRAAGLLRDRGRTDFSVDIYGPASDPFFPALIRQLDLEDRVRLCGVRTQAELAALYPRYDVFAFPTWEREPFAFAPMEAAAYGCAIVASRVSGNSEWFIDGLDCVKADRTPEGFADALEGLIGEGGRLTEIARRGMATVLRHFRLSAIVARIERELAAAAASPRPAVATPVDAYRLALLAEKTFHALVQETVAA